MRLIDTHYHYDFLPCHARENFRTAMANEGIGFIAQTVLPSGFLQLEREELAMPAVGFHPWYIAENYPRELEIFREALQRTRFVGEIGLDFAPRRLDDVSAATQLHVLRSILEAIRDTATPEPCVLSIHTVRSATAVLDLLEEVGVGPEHAIPIFHRFGGTSDELTRLVRSGGYISVNPLMLQTKRGRAYVAQVPVDKLLLETDLPRAKDCDASDPAGQVAAALRETVRDVAKARKMDVDEFSVALENNAQNLGF
ncbi:MAG: TatD family hydrolase [Corynebacterium sp.]|uniref:TatD family hydrolase n=1 Tax=Corynebacterium sp. TaxID=1720 RepID=UPI0026DB1512|nr:TatD family hydrolase [Corynebacterium sp.]MDO5029340.1 TatD family hydrolase [Corynebacterium sp.]